MTTKSTINECSKVLKDFYPKRIDVLALARTVTKEMDAEHEEVKFNGLDSRLNIAALLKRLRYK